MKLGIIGPSEEEILPLIGKMEDKTVHERAMLKYYDGYYAGLPVVAVFSGVCKVNAAIAAQIMIDRFEVTHIIITGVAGGLRDDLRVGETVIASEIAYHDVASGILTEYHPWMEDVYFRADPAMVRDCLEAAEAIGIRQHCQIGRIITGEAFITENERDSLIQRFAPLCVDMESAAVAHTCHVNAIPFLAVRSISDHANEGGTNSFEHNMVSSSLAALSVVEGLIRLYSRRGGRS